MSHVRSVIVAYLHSGAGGTAAATCDLDLHAGDVVLRLVDVGTVNTNVLHADEVLSVGSVLGDLGSDPVTVVVAPGGGGEVTTVADTLLVDLEPLARSVVGLDAAGGLGHVDQTGAGVLELSTDSQLEANLLAGVDSQDLSLAGRGESALVANNIGTVDGRAITDIGSGVRGELDGVVLDSTARLANVLEGRLSSTANDVGVEEVVSGGHLGDGSEGEGGNLHSDRAVMNVLEK
jgi:hypothetical protein